MKKLNYLDAGSLRRRALKIVSVFVVFWPAAVFAQHYQETDLVSNTMTEPTNPPNPPDPNLKNPWGIARGTTSPWWVSDNMAGVSTLYNGAGVKVPLTVTIPHTPGTATGSPTGIVFNGSTTDFVIPQGLTGAGLPGMFIFVSLDGTISAWNGGLPNRNLATQVVPGSATSVLTGATIAQIGDDRFLYVADIRQGKIAVYDTNFNPVEFGKHAFGEEHGEHAFDDEDVPEGFVPFNVQNIGNNLYVAFAQQNQAKNFVMFGAGLGFVDVFSPRGRLLMRLEHGDWFNAPWGLTLAPSDFGTFSHKVIVGQFGSGEILAFDAVTGRFEGKFKDPNNKVISKDGLWALAFGDGVVNSDPANQPDNALFFTAGPNFGRDGLFGTLTPITPDLTQGNDQ
jgi:uncharacterized protein (TIGR03118 family)